MSLTLIHVGWVATKQNFDDTVAIHPTSSEGTSRALLAFSTRILTHCRRRRLHRGCHDEIDGVLRSIQENCTLVAYSLYLRANTSSLHIALHCCRSVLCAESQGKAANEVERTIFAKFQIALFHSCLSLRHSTTSTGTFSTRLDSITTF